MRRPLARVFFSGYASTKCLKEDVTIAGIYLGDPKKCCQLKFFGGLKVLPGMYLVAKWLRVDPGKPEFSKGLGDFIG